MQTSNESNLELSIVLPCLNEVMTLAPCIEKAKIALQKNKIQGEIIIADNGSTDGSQKLARQLGAKVVDVKQKGYGAALMGGIAVANGSLIIMGDADDSYDFSSIYPIVEELRKGNQLVMGCRMPRGGGKIMPGAMPWKHRWIGNPILSTIGRIFFKSNVVDFHCGLRGFHKSAFDEMNLKTTGMEFASEMVIKATLLKMKISQTPITLYKDGRDRPPHLRSWRDGWRHLRFMLLFSPKWLFLTPGILLVIIGLFLTLLLLKSPIHLGEVVLDTNTLLFSSISMIIGFQLIYFSFFTKIFTKSVGLLPNEVNTKYIDIFSNLEIGILTGLSFVVIGFALLVKSILYWKHYKFGIISYPDSLRMVIPAAMMLALGFQIIFGSFFINVLKLPHK
ncbi:MAG: glycosyltransferase family 2 protein [Deltaproteobacteria bacterium]|nr:glycosyltransferase family 2 protein [Deltaproteobacteria bacterium]